jgi:Ca2+-binding EF-hand superfamily protein
MVPLLAVTQIASTVGAVKSALGNLKSLHAAVAPRKSFESALTAAKKDDLEKKATELIKVRDKDGNGKLSAREFGGDKGVFAKLDGDGDGELSKMELVKGLGANPKLL